MHVSEWAEELENPTAIARIHHFSFMGSHKVAIDKLH
jgi:hypothetical protein